jgi:surface antigen
MPDFSLKKQSIFLYDEIPYNLRTIVSSWKQRWDWRTRFVLGSCTDYAASRRPDLFVDWDKRLIVGDAKGWLQNAQRLWMKTWKEPRKWAIAVFAPWRWATEYGHVAYVEAVSSKGILMITEMNYASLYTVTVRIIPSDFAIWYIY